MNNIGRDVEAAGEKQSPTVISGIFHYLPRHFNSDGNQWMDFNCEMENLSRARFAIYARKSSIRRNEIGHTKRQTMEQVYFIY